MAVTSIAGASCAGKSVFDRAGMLRAAHALARRRVANNRAWRSYREAFSDALKREWRVAKEAAAIAAFEAAEAALPPTPADIAERAAAMRADAWYEPITTAGNERMVAIFKAADALLEPYQLQL